MLFFFFIDKDLSKNLNRHGEVVEKWRDLTEWARSGREALDHIAHQLETNCSLEEIERKLSSTEDELSTWTQAFEVVEHLISEAGVEGITPLPSVLINELVQRAQHLR